MIEAQNIDLSKLTTNHPERQAELASLAKVCESHGFFQIINHGISENIQDEFQSQIEWFFALPMEEKLALERSLENPWGYYNKELTKNKPDWKEVFDFGIDASYGEINSRSQWPAEPAFKNLMLDWHKACRDASMKLLDAIFETLNQPANQTRIFFEPQDTSFLRLNYYPPCENPASDEQSDDGYFGVSHHTDAGALTLLMQDNVPGLQFLLDGHWQTVKPVKGAICINLGDMLQVWSNDRYKAPLHRVLANAELARYSAPFFLNPAYETECVPLDSNQPHYKPINWGEFRYARASGDYADYGDEIQISQYRV